LSQLVFNTSPLSHFARAGELSILEDLTSDDECFVTKAVLEELERGSVAHPELAEIRRLEWLTVVPVDSLAELQAFAEYSRRLGSGLREVGEASTLAWAETHGQ
jgi:predicted nucleic acid-binding protein